MADAARGPERVLDARGGPVRELVYSGRSRPRGEPAAVGQVKDQLGTARHGKRRIVAPEAGNVVHPAVGLGRLLDIDRNGRLAHDAGVLASQPVGEKARGFIDPVDAGARPGRLRRRVHPGADQQLPGTRQTGVHAQHGVHIAVVPARDEIHGDSQPVVAGPQRSVAPVGPVHRVLDPLEQIRLVVCEALLPDFGPTGAGQFRLWRQGVHGDHRVAVGAHVVVHAQIAAAIVVAVVSVTVVGGVEGHNRFQAGRLMQGHLDRREPAVRDAVHAHVAVSPGTAGQPFDRVHAIELFLQPVLVRIDPFGGARAARIQAHRSKSALGEVEVLAHAAPAHIVLAVGMVHDNDGELSRRVRAEDVRRQPLPIAHRDHDRAFGFHRVLGWKDDGRGGQHGCRGQGKGRRHAGREHTNTSGAAACGSSRP